MEYLVVFALAVGLLFLGWCLFGLLLAPVFGKDMVTYYTVTGSADAMELRVRAYGWLRDGRGEGGRLVLVDHGLNAEGCHRAQLLCVQYPWVTLEKEENL